MKLYPRDIAAAAHKAGFHDRGLVMAVAIALAESGGDTAASGFNGPTAGCPHGSVDRGLWQINDCYHAEVTSRCAHDPQCSAAAAYRISDGGSNWTPWSTYGNGVYKQHLAAAAAGVAHMPRSVKPNPLPTRPWSMELHPWQYRSQLTGPTEAGYPPTNRSYDCGQACASMILQYEYDEFWSEDHLLNIMFPNGHTGDTTVRDMLNLLHGVFELPCTWETADSPKHARWLTWNALKQGYPVLNLGYLVLNNQTFGHYTCTTGMSYRSIILAGPWMGLREVYSYAAAWQYQEQGLIIVGRSRE